MCLAALSMWCFEHFFAAMGFLLLAGAYCYLSSGAKSEGPWVGLPSAEDLDAVAAEELAKERTGGKGKREG
ncbi:MAG: hypothetical protein ACRDQZ_25440 [Mycobacteriales bacterium]